jgi:site-specific recombinase XerC
MRFGFCHVWSTNVRYQREHGAVRGIEGPYSAQPDVQRRDLAIIFLSLDSGVRRGELAALTVEDVDLDHRELSVLGKGRRNRVVLTDARYV